MFRLPADVPVYLHRAPVDFRLGINGLAATVEHAMQHDPLARAVYAFCNRRCNRIKLLFWDRNGFWLLVKRLEADRFVWPKQESVITLTTEQLHWLLDGIDIEAVRRHPARHYRHAG
jgi:transposase